MKVVEPKEEMLLVAGFPCLAASCSLFLDVSVSTDCETRDTCTYR